jgi:hypothetical protein
MATTERITMTMRELDRFKVIQDVVDGRLKPRRAAERLGLTTRQIRRLAARSRKPFRSRNLCNSPLHNCRGHTS